MSREIKFRAWDTKTLEMLYPNVPHAGNKIKKED